MIVGIARRVLPISVYLRRRPLHPELQPERLRVYLRELAQRASLGAVVEVGCFRGGTTVAANQHLRSLNLHPEYLAIDTFEGFVAYQFDADLEVGTPANFRMGFAQNPKVIVERTMRHHRFTNVRVVQSDIAAMAARRLPEKIGVCLMDVDLALPIEAGLEKIVPKLVAGGIALVDDCDDGTAWKGAKVGYQRYCNTHGLPERYEAGFGIVAR